MYLEVRIKVRANRMRVLLTDRFCDRAKASQGQIDFFDENVSGLALRVTKHGVKAWTFIYTAPSGKRARITLGRYPMTSLGAARALAIEVKGNIEAGRDPRSITKAETLRAICQEYLKREGPALRSIDQRRSVFERLVLPVLGDTLVIEIRRSDIVRLLDKIEDENGPRAAHVVLAYLSKLFNWHASREDDFRSPIVRGMGRVKPKERARDRVLSDDEIRTVWKAANELKTPFSRYVQFLLLTAARRNEAAKMRRAELAEGIWTIPAERMKAKQEHVVPLSAAALSLLPAIGEFMFSLDDIAPITSFSNRKEEFDRAAPLSKPWTLHDLRRTARSLMSRAQVPADIAERCLAHVIGGVRGVYDRHAYLEEKRHAFEALAGLVQRIIDPQPNVVSLHNG
jgi:integrase